MFSSIILPSSSKTVNGDLGGWRRTFTRIISVTMTSIFYFPKKNFRILRKVHLNFLTTFTGKYQCYWQSKDCYVIVITPWGSYNSANL